MPISTEQLKVIFREVLGESTNANHTIHHTWIAKQIEKEEARIKMYNTLTKAMLNVSIPAICALLWNYGVDLWKFFVQYLNHPK